MPVKEIKRWFDVNKGMKICRSTLCVWISAYKRGSYFSQRYHSLHNPSTDQDLTNSAQGEDLPYGAQDEQNVCNKLVNIVLTLMK